MSLVGASAALEAYDGLYFLVAEDGTLAEWNDAVRELTGHSDAELSSLSAPALFEEYAANGVNEAIEGARRSGEATIEAPLVLPNGDTAPYEIALSAVEDGIAGIGREVSQRQEQRNSLQRRERVLRGMHDIVSDTDRDFEEQVEAMLLLGREELGVDYGTLSRIEDEDYRFEIVSSADSAIEAGDVVPVSATNCEIVAADERSLVLGNVIEDAPEETDRAGYADWGISCYLGAPVMIDGDVYGTFCFYDTEPREEGFSAWHVTLVDLMSRWVSYELQRKRTNERLRRQNRKLDRFASIVSHDLRNPLNVLSGSLGLAEETGDTEHFGRAERAVDRMEALIDDLLVLAQAGNAIEEPEPVPLGSLVRDCWEGVETDDASLVVESEHDLVADSSRLRQLLENLLSNAVEHGAGGETETTEGVTVTVGDLESGFYVADNGVGIPDGDHDSIFESGFSTRADGTGFGLTIVQEVAEAHGWSVRVVENDGGGARFEFTGVERPVEAEAEAEE